MTNNTAAVNSHGRVALLVLGCAKNQVEAESMSSRLAREGWELTSDFSGANAVVIHSCGFLAAARAEALKTIADVRKLSPRSFLVLTGCFAQYTGQQKPKGVDALLGTGEFHRLPNLLETRGRPAAQGLTPTLSLKGRGSDQETLSQGERVKTKIPSPLGGGSREAGGEGISVKSSPGGHHDAALPRPIRPGQLSSYLRISEGCNHRCTFCIIPQLRGNLKSRTPEDIQSEARNQLSRGIRELAVISQDTTDYGRDLIPPASIVDIVQMLLQEKDLEWLRLLYAYPSEVGDRLIDLLATEPRLCGYLDMPLQHISDKILLSMARQWGENETRALLDKLVARVPHLALRTTFITGFPGETDADFKKVLKLIEGGIFEHVGVFPYSLEERSPSSRFGAVVPEKVINERWEALLSAQTAVMEKRARRRAGQKVRVLVERDPNGSWTARAPHQAPEVDGQVILAAMPEKAGFYDVRITGHEGIDLHAELAEPPLPPLPPRGRVKNKWTRSPGERVPEGRERGTR